MSAAAATVHPDAAIGEAFNPGSTAPVEFHRASLITLTSESLTVGISPVGAELQSVRDRDGAEWLWHGAPAFWSGRAPLLFPVIGRSPGDQVTIDGQAYPMPVHGFARTSHFEIMEQTQDSCRLRLLASAASRAHYPLDFELALVFAVQDAALTVRAEICNLDRRAIPLSFGFHPAFPWPLPGSSGIGTHVCQLAHAGEPAVRRLDADGLLLQVQSSPFYSGVLPLRQALFEQGTLIFEQGAGSPLHYGVPGKPGIAITCEGLPQLGLWTKPGAPFLCIEPWQGLPPLADAGAALEERPGIHLLAPGATLRLTMTLAFGVRVPSGPAG